MRVFIYAYDNIYEGLHGMYDYGFYEADSEKEAEETAIDLSCGVIESYYEIEDALEEEADACCDDKGSEEWSAAYDEAVMQDTAYEIYALKDKVKEKTDNELCELVWKEGVQDFIKKYCEVAEWE